MMTGYVYRGKDRSLDETEARTALSSREPSVKVAVVRLDDIQFHAHNVRVDLGDLRDLVASITDLGVTVPVVLERRGDMLRVRDGHRRVAAARLAGRTTIPAVVHAKALSETDWLRSAVHTNTRRADMSLRDKIAAARAMRAEGRTYREIGADLGVGKDSAARWCTTDIGTVEHDEHVRQLRSKAGKSLAASMIGARKVRAALNQVRALTTYEHLTAEQVLDAIEELLTPKADS